MEESDLGNFAPMFARGAPDQLRAADLLRANVLPVVNKKHGGSGAPNELLNLRHFCPIRGGQSRIIAAFLNSMRLVDKQKIEFILGG